MFLEQSRGKLGWLSPQPHPVHKNIWIPELIYGWVGQIEPPINPSIWIYIEFLNPHWARFCQLGSFTEWWFPVFQPQETIWFWLPLKAGMVDFHSTFLRKWNWKERKNFQMFYQVYVFKSSMFMFHLHWIMHLRLIMYKAQECIWALRLVIVAS